MAAGLATAAPEEQPQAMTAGDLQQICVGSDSVSKTACRMFIYGVTQGVSVGMAIADGRTNAKRPCVPANLSSAAMELAVKIKLGEDLTVFPDDKRLDASGFIGAALSSTFPCQTK